MMNKSQFLRLCAGKLGLMAVAISSAFSVSSCADDEVLDRADKTPLQISVNTVSGVSRTLIHDDFLPGGSSIGLSLYNSADGLDYDNQGYANVKFTATGDGADQTWGTTGLAPSVSANEATLVAYYPYNGADDLDLTAVPVETASQTDYMFSGPVTGINNTNADKVEITMHHALTAVRVQLVLGDYSGKADVTDISVGSPALGSAATLNAADGALAAITGKGDMLTLPAGFTLAATGTDTDFLLVPDAEVVSGTTTVTATIGGKTYSAGIEFSKAYQQGYIYTYILTLNNSGFEVTKVKVNPWEPGGTKEGEFEIFIEDDEYIVEVTIPSDNYTYKHNMSDYDVEIDWGDGSVVEKKTAGMDDESWNVYAGGQYPAHTYSKAGTYIVRTKGRIQVLTGYHATKDISKLIHLGKDCQVERLYDAFKSTQITEIPEGFLDGCAKVTDFMGTFAYCKNLQTIPAGLFDKCTEAINFGEANNAVSPSCFAGCTSLTQIPEGLFDKCTKAKYFNEIFDGCTSLTSIPEGLFDNCTEVIDFSYAFSGCTSLTSIPEGLFDDCANVLTFNSTFNNCTSLQTIPEGLFDKCTEVTSFKGAFYGCKSLAEIPQGLFDFNTKVTNFSYAFEGCASLTTIPEGLFDKCTEVTSFGMTFYGCTNLQTIPSDLFKYNVNVVNLTGSTDGGNSETYGIFAKCINLTSIPSGLFDAFTKVKDFSGVFAGCTSLQTIPVGLFDKCTEVIGFLVKSSSTYRTYGTFQGCTALQTIPAGLFDYNTKVTDFGQAFHGCSALQTIPEGLFDKCTEVTSFANTFGGCKSLTSIPEGLFDNNTKVTDFGKVFEETSITSIPEGLFDNNTLVKSFSNAFNKCKNLKSIPQGLFDKCTEVTNFSWAFSQCTNLTTIPEGLFDACIKVTNLYYTFSYCRSLTSESPYTTINIDGVDTKVHLYERANYPEYFTAPTSYSSCFYNSSKLIDYSSIPSGWK